MSLLDEMRDMQRRPGCRVGPVLDKLNPKDRADLAAAFAEPGIYHTTIAAVLEKRGFGKFNAPSISRHRRGDCPCAKS